MLQTTGGSATSLEAWQEAASCGRDSTRLCYQLTPRKRPLDTIGCIYNLSLAANHLQPITYNHYSQSPTTITYNQSPTANHLKPITYHQSITYNYPITYIQSPTTNHLQPITYNQSPTTKHVTHSWQPSRLFLKCLHGSHRALLCTSWRVCVLAGVCASLRRVCVSAPCVSLTGVCVRLCGVCESACAGCNQAAGLGGAVRQERVGGRASSTAGS